MGRFLQEAVIKSKIRFALNTGSLLVAHIAHALPEMKSLAGAAEQALPIAGKMLKIMHSGDYRYAVMIGGAAVTYRNTTVNRLKHSGRWQ